MSAPSTTPNGLVQQWVTSYTEPSGQFTVQVVGVPELRATAETHAAALERVRTLLTDWLATGQLAPIDVLRPNPLLHFSGHLDPADPLEQEFVEELARLHREDQVQAQLEDDQGCPNSSSTPIT